jgi:hypothetical protein
MPAPGRTRGARAAAEDAQPASVIRTASRAVPVCSLRCRARRLRRSRAAIPRGGSVLIAARTGVRVSQMRRSRHSHTRSRHTSVAAVLPRRCVQLACTCSCRSRDDNRPRPPLPLGGGVQSEREDHPTYPRFGTPRSALLTAARRAAGWRTAAPATRRRRRRAAPTPPQRARSHASALRGGRRWHCAGARRRDSTAAALPRSSACCWRCCCCAACGARKNTARLTHWGFGSLRRM